MIIKVLDENGVAQTIENGVIDNGRLTYVLIRKEDNHMGELANEKGLPFIIAEEPENDSEPVP